MFFKPIPGYFCTENVFHRDSFVAPGQVSLLGVPNSLKIKFICYS